MIVGSLMVLLSLVLIITSCDSINTRNFDDEHNLMGSNVPNIYTSTTISSLKNDIETSQLNSAITTKLALNFNYQIPPKCKEVKWFSEDIIAKIEFEYYTPTFYDRNKFDDDGYRNLLLEDFYKHYPREIVDNLNNEIIPYIENNFSDLYDNEEREACKIVRIGCMKYDMNFDGENDYIINAWVSDNGAESQFGFDLFRVYIKIDNGNYKSIRWETHPYDNYCYILSTETNGVRDLMLKTNSNNPVSKYDGKDKYIDSNFCDDMHVFAYGELIEKNIIKIIINTNYVDINKDVNYYMLLKFKDNPYLKESVLYCCEPDGTPIVCNEEFESFDFYAELKDNVKWSDDLTWELYPNEIKYIPVE